MAPKSGNHTYSNNRSPASEEAKRSPEVPDERFDLQILQSIRRIIRAVDIYSRKLRSQYELTAPQLICLRTVVEYGPLTVSDLAHQVFLSPSTVVGILDRLEARGLIHRERDTVDRRIVNTQATESGKKVVAEAPSALQDSLHDALKELSKLEQATIALSLKKVVDLMEASRLDAAPILDTAPIDSHETHDKKGDL